ncbi:hypothetical protein MMC07_009825 [Pseudocyphellaria aurata]|nr:hypothetical protein [Pseudocyphellaria aurata]
MEPAKTLIRSVARAFYDTKHILVVDALMVHSALPNEDLALLLGMQQKDLRKLCGKLKEDRLLAVHSRQEIREGQQRPISKDYYYIDFHATIDAIKYRMYHLSERVKGLSKPGEENADFYCPRCHSQYTTLQVLDSIGPSGFLCHRCGGALEEQKRTAGDTSSHEKHSTLMSQIDLLVKLLREIDSKVIPNNDFEAAYAVAVPIQRNNLTNPSRDTQPFRTGNAPPTAVKGVNQNKAIDLKISVTTSSERTAAEQEAEAQRKAELAAQNSLPVWHTESTVKNESIVIKESRRNIPDGDATDQPKAEDKKKDEVVLEDELAEYYRQMQQEKEKEAREDREANISTGDEEEDDDDFEDVGIEASGDASPSSPAANGSKVVSSGKVSRKRSSESGSSGPGTNTSTPASSGVALEDHEDGPAAKRLKRVSQDSETGGAVKAGVGNGVDKDSDVDDELEFVDV